MLVWAKHLVLGFGEFQPANSAIKIHRAKTSSGGLGRRSRCENAVPVLSFTKQENSI